MAFFGARRTPREFAAALAARLVRAGVCGEIRVIAPMRLALLGAAGDAPLELDIADAYAAYQRGEGSDHDILAATAAAIAETLEQRDTPPPWEEARRSLLPFLHRDRAGAVAFGTLGNLDIGCTYARPLGGRSAVMPPAWGAVPEIVLRRALANLAVGSNGVMLRPLPDTPEIAQLLPADAHAASRLLLPGVRRAIHDATGRSAFVLLAAPDTVFACTPDTLGTPPIALRTAAAVRTALVRPDALSADPLLIVDSTLAPR